MGKILSICAKRSDGTYGVMNGTGFLWDLELGMLLVGVIAGMNGRDRRDICGLVG